MFQMFRINKGSLPHPLVAVMNRCGHWLFDGSLKEKYCWWSLPDFGLGQRNPCLVVTTFGSNFARLYSLLIAAKKSKTKVVMAGKSMKRIIETAKNTGYVDDD